MTCPKCHRNDRNDGGHICGHTFCNRCLTKHRIGRRFCFIRPRKPPINQPPVRHHAMDTECTLCGMNSCDGQCMSGSMCAVETDELRKKHIRLIR